MTNKNPNCCGGHCRSVEGEVRVYPLGGGANLILCNACWQHENVYREFRGRQIDGKHNPDWPLVDWDTAEVYGEEPTIEELMQPHHPDCPATDGFGCRCNGTEMVDDSDIEQNV